MYIYIHIPFCSSICSYCDFPKVLYDKKYINDYLDSLKYEIESRYLGEEVKSIYIGGGTPTSLDYEELKCLLEITNLFSKYSDLEFTIESNVECLSIDKIKLLNEYKVNRVSLGVQSFQENTLKELNRHHNKEDVIRVVSLLKESGINNISIDYIYGVNNKLEEIKKDIVIFLSLDIPHISCYSLIIEDSTLFGINNRNYIEDEKEEEMYRCIEDKLESNNYYHYEISNYARNGYQSRHNINYWNNGEYYGFGMGAVSFLDSYRIVNTKSLTKYINQEFVLSKEYEDINIQISNTFMLGFRMINGININNFKERYKIDILDNLKVKELLNQGKLILKENYLFIPKEYFYLSNEILLEFI